MTDLVEFTEKGNKELITLKLDDCPASLAITDLLNSRGVNYLIPSEFADVKVSANFVDIPFEEALFELCRQSNLFFYRLRNLYIITNVDVKSRYILLVRSSENDDLDKLLGVCAEKEANVISAPGYVCINDQFGTLQRIYNIYENIIKDNKRQYYLELWFVQSNLDSSLDIEANLQFKGFDILSGVNSINDILSCYLEADGEASDVRIVDYQSLYLCENKEGVFNVGTTLVRETKQVSEQGYASTSGFQEFKDGLELSARINFCEANKYFLNVDFKNSRYRATSTDKDIVPPNDVTEIRNNRLLVTNGKVFLVGQLHSVQNGKALGLVSVGRSDSKKLLTVYAKVRFIER